MKKIYIYIIKYSKTKYEIKTSKFKCNEVSVLITLVFVPQPSVLEMVPQMLFCSVSSKGRHKVEKNCTKKKHPPSVPSSNAIQFQ
jgi:hypothetical protein